MTLNLKLVRHHDGKWTALTTESDDLAQVSVTERKSAPIDPAQLLKALDTLLSPEGGIRSIEDVPRLASLMKKFSKKLVSRCVYCNVLQATKPEILSEFSVKAKHTENRKSLETWLISTRYLDKGGWETINTWLQYAKTSSADSFLLEMLKLCKQLPMTLNRLKENNTAKLIKSLTKHENDEVKELSSELVSLWMSIIKEKKISETSGDKKKKKDKASKVEKVEKIEPVKEDGKASPKSATESPKSAAKLRGTKRMSAEKEIKEIKPSEIYEDVKIDPEPLIPSKKPRLDRPKTAKIYQKKFRATGLEEETPLPKNISKKTSTVDKTAVAAAKNALKINSNPLDRIIEKKIKPESLMAINENANSKGIKLIPAKPRPTYVLHESASFIDALISQPVAPAKRKKKAPTKPAAPQQTSPTISPPKFQFYKDTLEEKMTDEKKEETEKDDEPETEKDNVGTVPENAISDATNLEENVPMDTTEEGGLTPPNDETNGMASPVDNVEPDDDSQPKLPVDPNQLRSILSHGKRRGKKKSVRWVEDSNIKEVHYFEMDDTERVNVSRNQNFYDLKSIEMKRERETMEMAKRQAGDRVEEFRKWWSVPVLIDLPPPLVMHGCQSQEKHIEIMRQQSTLQEIYFTREMIPDSPHEPDLEIVAAKEPKTIPLDEENLISTVNDYTNYMPIKPLLPEILTTLMKLNASQTASLLTPNVEPVQIPMDTQTPQQPLIVNEPVAPPTIPIPHNQPFEPVPEPPPPHGTPNGLLGLPPPVYNSPPDTHNSGSQGEWQGPEMQPNDQFYGGYQMNQNMPHNHPPQHPGMNMRGRGGNNFRSNYRGGSRGMGPRPRNRIICRHFSAGHCRFGMNCTFLHPGVNGPPL